MTMSPASRCGASLVEFGVDDGRRHHQPDGARRASVWATNSASDAGAGRAVLLRGGHRLGRACRRPRTRGPPSAGAAPCWRPSGPSPIIPSCIVFSGRREGAPQAVPTTTMVGAGLRRRWRPRRITASRGGALPVGLRRVAEPGLRCRRRSGTPLRVSRAGSHGHTGRSPSGPRRPSASRHDHSHPQRRLLEHPLRALRQRRRRRADASPRRQGRSGRHARRHARRRRRAGPAPPGPGDGRALRGGQLLDWLEAQSLLRRHRGHRPSHRPWHEPCRA